MLGRLNSKDRRATVIGGGIGGLITAYRLMRAGYSVKLIEASDRLGGLIQTKQHARGIAESAAHSLLASPAVQELCTHLGVELIPANPEAKARYIVRGGKMRRMPLNIFEIMGLIWHIFTARAPKDSAGQTLADWAALHLGEAALHWLVAPGVQGIYAASPGELSMDAAFPGLKPRPGNTLLQQLRRLRRERGKTRRPLSALRGGMSELTEALEHELRKSAQVEIQLGTKLSKLPSVADAGNIVLALPASSLTELLAVEDPHLAKVCRTVEYASLVSVTIFVKRMAFVEVPHGVGMLIPPVEARGEISECLGLLFNSSSFSQRVVEASDISLTVLFGGTVHPKSIDHSDEEIMRIIEKTLNHYWRPTTSGAFQIGLENCLIHRWPRAVPIYSNSISDLKTAFLQGWGKLPGHLLAGNLAGQVSIRGMIEESTKIAPNQLSKA